MLPALAGFGSGDDWDIERQFFRRIGKEAVRDPIPAQRILAVEVDVDLGRIVGVEARARSQSVEPGLAAIAAHR